MSTPSAWRSWLARPTHSSMCSPNTTVNGALERVKLGRVCTPTATPSAATSFDQWLICYGRLIRLWHHANTESALRQLFFFKNTTLFNHIILTSHSRIYTHLLLMYVCKQTQLFIECNICAIKMFLLFPPASRG